MNYSKKYTKTSTLPLQIERFHEKLLGNRYARDCDQYVWRKNHHIVDNATGEVLCSIEDITKKLKNNRKAELQNLLQAFRAQVIRDKLQTVFATYTVPTALQTATALYDFDKYDSVNDCLLETNQELLNERFEAQLTKQFEAFQHRTSYVKKDRVYRASLNNVKCPYLRALELTKMLTVHEHRMDCIPDSYEAVYQYITVNQKAKKKCGLGRTEIRLENKYREQLIQDFNLTCFKTDKNGHKHYYINQCSEDVADFKIGVQTIITFFSAKNSEHLTAQILSYIVKYVLKSQNLDTRNIAEISKAEYSEAEYNRARAVFSNFHKRAFSYSTGYIFGITRYRMLTKCIFRQSNNDTLKELIKSIDNVSILHKNGKLTVDKIEKEIFCSINNESYYYASYLFFSVC